jgi:mono/diheme cytochrome c family protein
LATVTVTWPDCLDHIRWVTLGSEGWRVEVGGTYGATAKPVQGGMPAHRDTLTPEQIAAVAAFERITYGGAAAAETLAACGVPAG